MCIYGHLVITLLPVIFLKALRGHKVNFTAQCARLARGTRRTGSTVFAPKALQRVEQTRCFHFPSLRIFLGQYHIKMSQGSEPSSVLLEIPLSERNLTAYLLDPFIPLLRGFDETTRVTALRPPSEPHIVRAPSSPNPPNLAAIIDREIGPAKRARLDRPGAPSSFPGMSGQTSNNLPLTGFQLEAAHHASIKDDIQHAIDVIRRQWVNMTCGPNSHSEWWLDPHALSHPAHAQLELLSYPTATSSNPWLDWPTLTRDSLEVRKTQFTSDNMSVRVSECKPPYNER